MKAACLRNVNDSLADLLHRLNPVLRGWTAYFRPGVSNVTFEYLRSCVRHRVMRWIRKKHRRINREKLRRRYCTVSNDRWWPADGDVILFNPASVSTTRYRYRGHEDPVAVAQRGVRPHRHARVCGAPDALRGACPVREAARGNGLTARPAPRPESTSPQPRTRVERGERRGSFGSAAQALVGEPDRWCPGAGRTRPGTRAEREAGRSSDRKV